MANIIDFADWLEEELQERGMKPIDLSRAAGIDSGSLSRILSKQRGAGPETCQAIAHALRLPVEEVYRRAGLLPERSDYNVQEERIMHLFNQLSDEQQEIALALVETLVEHHEQQHPERHVEPKTEKT